MAVDEYGRDYDIGVIGVSTVWASTTKKKLPEPSLTERGAATLQNGLLRAWRENVKYMTNGQILELSRIQTNLVSDFMRIHLAWGDDFRKLGDLAASYKLAWDAVSRTAAEQSLSGVQDAFDKFDSLVAAATRYDNISEVTN